MLFLRSLVLALGLLTAAGGAASADPSVTIENFTFTPTALTVHAGTRVLFKNADDIPHSVVLADGSFHSRALDTDETVAVTFARAGDFAYFCGLHPHMQGKITVVP